MPFDVRRFRDPSQFWVVKTRDGGGIAGHLVTASEHDHADVVITNHHRVVVAIANDAIDSIKAGHVIRMAGWYCFFGYTPGDRTSDIWCEHGVTKFHLVYHADQGLSPRPIVTPSRPHDLPESSTPMSEMLYAHLQLVMKTMVDAHEAPDARR